MTVSPGTRIAGRFLLRRELGQGGGGQVFVAEDQRPRSEAQKLVALKILRSSQSHLDALPLFRQEFEFLAQIQHAHIARTFEFGWDEANDLCFFTSELIRGEPLSRLPKSTGLQDRIRIAIEIIEAVDFLHRRNIVHRDLKPGNIMVEADNGSAKILDFGLASLTDSIAENTGLLHGTPAYLAPELFHGDRAGPASDLYALGLVLWRLFWLESPFAGLSSQDIFLKKRQTLEAPPISFDLTFGPEPLRHLILRLVDRNPLARPPSASSLLQELGEIFGQPVSASPPIAMTASLSSTGLIGREILATDLLRLAEEGRRRKAVLITGDSGVGKTFLLEHLARRISQSRDCTLILAARLPDIVHELQGRNDITRKDREFLNVLSNETFVTSIEDGSDLTSFRNRFAQLLVQLSLRKRIVLIVDDGFQTDPGLALLLPILAKRILRQSNQLGLFVSAPSDGAAIQGPSTQDLESVFEIVRLPSFEHPQICDFLHRTFPGLEQDETFVQKLQRITLGNPLSLRRTLEILIEARQLRWEDGRWMVHSGAMRSLQDIGAQKRPGEMLRRRLDTVDQTGREILQTFALLDDWIPANHLSGIFQDDSTKKSSNWASSFQLLRREEFLIQDRSFRYRIASGALSQVIRELLSPEQRKQIFHRIALRLQNIAAAESKLVARSFQEAGENALAAPYWVTAAKQAIGNANIDFAIEALTKAESFLQNDVQHQALLDLGNLLRIVGRYNDAAETYRRLASATNMDASFRMEACRLWGNTLRLSSQLPEAIRAYDLGLSCKSSDDKSRRMVRLLQGQRALALGLTGKTEQAIQICSDLLDEPHSTGPDSAKADLLAIRGRLFEEIGNLQEAKNDYELALPQYRQDQQPRGEMLMMANLAQIQLREGALPQSLQRFRKALALAEKLPDPVRALRCTLAISQLEALFGRLDRAKRLTQYVRRESDVLGLKELWQSSVLVLARIDFSLGHWESALAGVRRVRSNSAHGKNLERRIAPLLEEFDMLLERGETNGASDILSQCKPSAPDLSPARHVYLNLLELRLQRETGQSPKSDALLPKLLKQISGLDTDLVLRTTYLVHLAELSGGLETNSELTIALKDPSVRGILSHCKELQIRHDAMATRDRERRSRISHAIASLENPWLIAWAECSLAKQAFEDGESESARQHIAAAKHHFQAIAALLETSSRQAFTAQSRLAKRIQAITGDESVQEETPSKPTKIGSSLLQSLRKSLEEGSRTADVLQSVLSELILQIGADRGLIAASGDPIETIQTFSRDGNSEEIPIATMSTSVMHRVVQSREPFFSAVAEDPKALRRHQTLVNLEIRTVLCVPLLVEDRIIGLFYADQRIGPIGMQESDLSRVTEIAPFLALLVESHVTRKELNRKTDQLEHQLAERTAELTVSQESLRRLEGDFQTLAAESGLLGGQSRSMRSLLSLIARVAPSQTNVLIEGESGTGKELVARALHSQGMTTNAPFVVANCGSLNRELFQAELFGFVKGAFTGATQEKPGLFELANGGTLFLDEIGELPLDMQALLLRAVQNQEVQRLGDTVLRTVNVRIIAATNRTLREEVTAGRFREDLFYRLNVIHIEVPALRDRLEDLPVLVRHFLRKHSEPGGRLPRVTKGFMSALESMQWPGNIRQLEHVLQSILILQHPKVLKSDMLPSDGERQQDRVAILPLEDAREAFHADYVRSILRATRWKVSEAARLAGVKRQYIYALMKRHRIEDGEDE